MDHSTSKLKSELIRVIKQRSYREGDFTLASGKKSKFYIDLKATTLHPEGAQLIGKLAVQMIKEANFIPQGVGGLTLGADPLATAISLAAWQEGLFWPAFIVRKESKGHGTGKVIEGAENLKPGAQVIVLEDVVTTGGSSLQAIQKLREAGYNPIAALTVVDRQDNGEATLAAENVRLLSLVTLQELMGK